MRAAWEFFSVLLLCPIVAACATAPNRAAVQGQPALPAAEVDASEQVDGARMPERRSVALDNQDPRIDRLSTSAESDGGAATAVSSDAGLGSVAEAIVADEPPYPPGGRSRPPGSVPASRDDEVVATWNHGGLGAISSTGPETKAPHPAPRIKVDVVHVGGSLKEADVLRAARLKAYWPFRICYEKGLLRAQKLHGKLKLQLTVGASGTPAHVQKLSAELADQAVVSCLLQAAMGLTLPAPESGTIQVTLEVSLWPGDDPVSVRTTSSRGRPGLDRAALVAALRARLATVRACYAEGLRRHEGLWGRLALRLHISAAGKIDEVCETESHFPDPGVTECVLHAFTHADAPASGQELVVVYPLRFGTAPDPSESRR